MNSPIQSNERIPSFKIERALFAPNFAESVSNPGFRLVLICPPFLELPPHPASSASNTRVSNPFLEVCKAVSYTHLTLPTKA